MKLRVNFIVKYQVVVELKNKIKNKYTFCLILFYSEKSYL